MQSKHPNRFFGLNPVGVPNNGRKEVEWSHDLPTDWRSAVAGVPASPSLPDEESELAGDADDA